MITFTSVPVAEIIIMKGNFTGSASVSSEIASSLFIGCKFKFSITVRKKH